MSVLLYLILATILLIIAVVGATSASIETSGLRWYDRTITPENDRQHALLGECIEWSTDIAAYCWKLIGISYLVIFSFALASGPLRSVSEHRPMPALFVAAGLIASVAIIVVGRSARYKARKLIRQYHEIRAGQEPVWAAVKA